MESESPSISFSSRGGRGRSRARKRSSEKRGGRKGKKREGVEDEILGFLQIGKQFLSKQLATNEIRIEETERQTKLEQRFTRLEEQWAEDRRQAEKNKKKAEKERKLQDSKLSAILYAIQQGKGGGLS